MNFLNKNFISSYRKFWGVIFFCSALPLLMTPSNYFNLKRLFFSPWGKSEIIMPSPENVPLVQKTTIERLPQDFKSLPLKKRKEEFIKHILPLVLEVNEGVLEERTQLLKIQEKIKEALPLTNVEQELISTLEEKYRTKGKGVQELLKRVDVIPPSLALAQAALESGYGSSRAALEDNSTFGHMKTLTKIAAFASLKENVEAYILNLNRHLAYKEFRAQRATLRQRGAPLSSKVLADELLRYCVYGKKYTDFLKKLIEDNKFERFDQFKLHEA